MNEKQRLEKIEYFISEIENRQKAVDILQREIEIMSGNIKQLAASSEPKAPYVSKIGQLSKIWDEIEKKQ
jgi:hypothetical protein